MTQNKNFFVGLLFCLFALSFAFAIEPEVQRYINEGNGYLSEGNLFSAEKMYVNAKGVAVDKEDWDGLLHLTDRFIHAKSEYHAHDSYSLANDFAESICTFAKETTNPKQECQRGIAAMNQCVLSGDRILRTLSMSADTAVKIRNTMNITIDNVRIYQEKGCPK